MAKICLVHVDEENYTLTLIYDNSVTLKTTPIQLNYDFTM